MIPARMRSKSARRIHRYLGTLLPRAPAPLPRLPPPPDSHDPELCFWSGGLAEDPLSDIRDPLSPLEDSLLPRHHHHHHHHHHHYHHHHYYYYHPILLTIFIFLNFNGAEE